MRDGSNKPPFGDRMSDNGSEKYFSILFSEMEFLETDIPLTHLFLLSDMCLPAVHSARNQINAVSIVFVM